MLLLFKIPIFIGYHLSESRLFHFHMILNVQKLIILIFCLNIGLAGLFLNHLANVDESLTDFVIDLTNVFLDGVDESKPLHVFSLDHHIAGFHKNHKLDLFKISFKLIYYLLVV